MSEPHPSPSAHLSARDRMQIRLLAPLLPTIRVDVPDAEILTDARARALAAAGRLRLADARAARRQPDCIAIWSDTQGVLVIRLSDFERSP